MVGDGTHPLVLVAAGVLLDGDGRLLIAKRPEGRPLAGMWEFPGGKVEAGETPEHALIRELAEELGIDIAAADLTPLTFVSHRTEPDDADAELRLLEAVISEAGTKRVVSGKGTGPIDAFVDAVNRITNLGLEVIDYHEHAIGTGANATAVAYVEARNAAGMTTFGVARHRNIVSASLSAVLSAANRFIRAG